MSTNETFVETLNLAKKKQVTNQKDFVDLFAESFTEVNSNGRLSQIFSTLESKVKIKGTSTNN